MRVQLKIIVIVFFASIASVFLLYIITSKRNVDNGFERVVRNDDELSTTIVLDLKSKTLRIAGIASQNVFITDDTYPYRIICLNLQTGDTASYTVRTTESLSDTEVAITVDSPYFFVADRFKHILLRGKLNVGLAEKYVLDSTFFNDAIPISHVSLAVRAITRGNDYIWAKESLTAPHLIFHPNILEKQREGIFSTDGFMVNNYKLPVLVFVYFYRNEFTVLDTNLTVLYRHHTIDTNRIVTIGTAMIQSENTISASSPLTVTNKDGYMFGDMLYINSALMASNEKPENFRNNTVIDTYSIHSGNYQGSFYIPAYKNQKVWDFSRNDQFLVTIQGTFVCVYNYSR